MRSFVLCFALLASSVSATVVTATAGTVLAVAGIAALGKAKGLAVGAAAAAGSRRGKRQVAKSAESQVWESVSNLEDEECVRRFLCEVASGHFDAPEYKGIVEHLNLQGEESDVYAKAAKFGTINPDVDLCRAEFKCAQSGIEIYETYKNL